MRFARLAAWLMLLACGSAAATGFDGGTVARAAMQQVGVTVLYDPGYTRIKYPNGDVSRERGVCTDVVIRAFRAVGIDLQQKVHEDMGANFKAYPQKWGLARPDSNIDHRRVPNLQTWFSRQHRALPASRNAADYRAGDVVSWKLPNGLDHIGVVSATRTAQHRPLVVHNIGAGAQEEDVLFAWPITGHYRWFKANGAAP